MIDSNILNILKTSDNSTINYSVLVKDIQQIASCNRDTLQVTVQQINPSLMQIIKSRDQDIAKLKTKLNDNFIDIPTLENLGISNIVEKTLTINSAIDFNQTSNMFTSKLVGGISNESNQEIPEIDKIKDITAQHLEYIVTQLNSRIHIDFSYAYTTLPAIVLTIDEDEKWYSSYSYNFTQNASGEYTGVTISFKNLKRKRVPADINILIIGDEINETDDS